MVTEQDKETASPTLGELLDGLTEQPLSAAARELVVSGLTDDSRQARPGGLFVAIRGTSVDGRKYVGDAVTRGASVLVGEDLEPVGDAVVVNVADARVALARLAARWYGIEQPAGAGPCLLGITGTNGKTTVAFMTRAILRAGGLHCGMLGTVRYDLGSRSIAAGMTTPGPLALSEYVRQCTDDGARAIVMEVSSHALDQRRTAGLRFSAAAFTNLTRDHLDYHKTIEAYCEAKRRLFAELDESATVVVNVDDPYYEQMTRDCRGRVLTFGLDQPADITARITAHTIDGTCYQLDLAGTKLELENALLGRHNVYNALAAAGLAHAVGMEAAAIEEGLASVKNVPGRLQRVPGITDPAVFVDYAHTPDALRNAAGVLKPLVRKRLIVVFGCGGDRDRAKRPMMAQAVAEYADVIVVTSDNPRTENPRSIIDEILVGFDRQTRGRVLVEPDRRSAIHAALAGAAEGDVVLIAGKGHEDYQVLGTERHHFDDVEVAIQAAGVRAGKGEA